MSIEEVHAACRIDPWFLARIKEIVEAEATIAADGLPDSPAGWLAAKSMGFSDARLGQLTGREEEVVAARRRAAGVRPVYKRIDTCAGEIPSDTPYMYATYETCISGPGGAVAAEDTQRGGEGKGCVGRDDTGGS